MDELLRDMITPPAPRRDPARRRRLITTTAILGLAGLGMTSLVTSAIFTDNDDAGRTGITTGSVDIDAGEDVAFPLPPGNLAPGDEVYSPVTVRNQGSLALVYGVQYTATSTTGGPLADRLSLDLFAAPAGACSEQGLAGAAAIGAAPAPLTTATIVATERRLIAGAGEELCVRVSLPEDLGNEFQESSADLSLTFVAQQAPDPHATS
jgi:hypothetical protein